MKASRGNTFILLLTNYFTQSEIDIERLLSELSLTDRLWPPAESRRDSGAADERYNEIGF